MPRTTRKLRPDFLRRQRGGQLDEQKALSIGSMPLSRHRVPLARVAVHGPRHQA